MIAGAEIVQRDDGGWSLGWHDEAPGPFASRAHAEAVAVCQLRGDRRSPQANPTRRRGR
jgi:hypothetical protein